MPKLFCPSCMKPVSVSEGFADRKVTCPSCGKGFDAPAKYTPTVLDEEKPSLPSEPPKMLPEVTNERPESVSPQAPAGHDRGVPAETRQVDPGGPPGPEGALRRGRVGERVRQAGRGLVGRSRPAETGGGARVWEVVDGPAPLALGHLDELAAGFRRKREVALEHLLQV